MFKIFEPKKKLLEDDGSVIVITSATSKDHRDVHYLYKLRRAVSLLVGEESLKGYSEKSLEEIHTSIARILIDNGSGHWYDDWDSDLDDTLPDDLKMASSGYDPPPDQSMFDLEETEYRVILQEFGAISLWTAPTARKKVPSNHFLMPKEKKFPYKNADGTVNCGGLKAAYSAARGARGAPKRPKIASKAKRLLNKHCDKKKNSNCEIAGKLI